MLVKNRSWGPRILTVSGGKKGKPKTIALKGRHSVEVSQEELESPEIQQLIAVGDLYLLPEKAGTGKAAKSAGKSS